MKYQLALQWPCGAENFDYDDLIQIEDLLSEQLAQGAEVDGHDVGEREMNIFILTNEPVACFQTIRTLLADQPAWRTMRAAYREVSGTAPKYVPVWPHGLTDFRVA